MSRLRCLEMGLLAYIFIIYSDNASRAFDMTLSDCVATGHSGCHDTFILRNSAISTALLCSMPMRTSKGLAV